jgi:hypothetical protein
VTPPGLVVGGDGAGDTTVVVGLIPELAHAEPTRTLAITATAVATARIPICIRHRQPSCHGVVARRRQIRGLSLASVPE